MNTAIVNIESVYELAKSKGYKSPYYIPVNTDIQLYLIQQWLRDKHKIIVEISADLTDGHEDEFYYDIMKNQKNVAQDTIENCLPYEEVLLHGINEALQLI